MTFAFMGQLCIQKISPTTNITFQRNILHLYLPLPPAEISIKRDFSWPWTLTVLSTNLYSIRSGRDKNSIFQT